MAKNRRGRDYDPTRHVYPTRESLQLDDAMIEAVVSIVKRGNFRRIAFMRVGVQPSTYRSWLSRGQLEINRVNDGEIGLEHLTPKGRLVLALEKAESELHDNVITDVLEYEGPGAAKVKLDFLSRRFPKLHQRGARSIDDETGEDVHRDVAELLADKLANFLDDS